MTIRQLIQLDGNITNDNLPLLDVTPQEIEVAALPNVIYWPALGSWGADDTNTGFLDRISDAVHPASGHTSVASQFVIDTDGKESYNLSGSTQVLHDPVFDTAGSFTIGVVHEGNLGMGGYTATNSWFVSSSSGKLRFSIGGLSTYGDYSDYAGPLINDGARHYSILTVDREENRITLTVDGQLAHSKTGAIGVLAPQLVFGRTNAAGTVQGRYGRYRAPIAFSGALTGDDLVVLEAMLAELTD